jgi:hypothetical protein
VQAVIDHQARTIAGNQGQADLGTPGGLRAWRDTVIAQAEAAGGAGGCRSARSPDNSPRPTRAPAPGSQPASSSGPPPSAQGREDSRPSATSRLTSTLTITP